MRRKHSLLLELLEDRLAPSTSHALWPDVANLTMSFAPDGTMVDNSPSGLFAMLNAAAPTATWETAIVGALQNWASNANINIGIVPDGGQPLGTGGAVQGDARFGDIRIAAVPLQAGTVATTAFFSWTGSTWHGDIVLNSNYSFGVNGSGQYDLFSVILHEAGHVFSFDDETSDVTSANYMYYTGPRSGLTSQDIVNLDALYGTRPPDSFNTQQPNNSFSSAAPVANPSTSNSWQLADLTTLGNAEYFKLTTPNDFLLTSFNFLERTSGVSLLVPSVTVYSATQKALASAAATSPLDGDLSLTFSAKPNTTYYVEVNSATNNVFSIGDFQFTLTYNTLLSLAKVPPLVLPYSYVNNLDQNNSINHAIDLTNPNNNMTGIASNYLYRETLDLPTDANFFKVQAPTTPGISSYTLSALAWGDGLLPLSPIVHVFDAQGNPQPLVVQTNSGGTYAIQIANATPGASYYVEVAPLQPSLLTVLSSYSVYVNFSATPPIALAALASATLSQNQSQASSTLTTNVDELFHFVLQTSTTSTNMSINMTVVDQDGNTVLSLSALGGQPPATAMIYLPAGAYTITYTASSTNGDSLAPITFWLLGEDGSEIQGPYTTKGSSGSTSNGTGGYTASGGTTGGTPPATY